MVPCARRVAALALLTVSVSCTPTTSPSPSPSTSPSTAPITLHLMEAEDAQTLDPALIDDPTSLAIGGELFDGLTRLDGLLRPQPGLAQRWEIQDGGRTYTFHLRAAHYHSGAAVRAQDAVVDWTRALAAATASPLATFFAPLGAQYPGDPLTGVQALDASTLQVTLARPDSEFLTLLAQPPYWLYDPASTTQPPVGSGPYVLGAWQRGRHLELRAAASDFHPLPQVQKVSIDIDPDGARRLAAFRQGQADIVHGLSGPQLLDFARSPTDLRAVHQVPTGRVTWLGFNTVAGSGYSQVERLAIAQAIDRRRLTDVAFFGSFLSIPANDLLPPGIPGSLDRALPAYDPAAARKALDDAGFAGPIDLYFSTNPTVGRVARDLQDQIASATGRTVTLHPTGDFFNRAALDELPVLIDTWSADVPYAADLLEHIVRGGAQFNNLHLDDPAVNAALDQGRAALTFEASRAAYQAAVQLVLGDGRMIPLYSGVEPYLVRPGLQPLFIGSVIPYRWEDVRGG